MTSVMRQAFMIGVSIGEFKPGYNDGHIPNDQQFESDEDGYVQSFSGYQEWPHAGVLSTQAWLARYPSTDTNRNRARARWTYYHFLGVDIEKSAPRTTDPVALADTNNPTMNNSACTICHQRLDPVAGAYQSFGDFGHYLINTAARIRCPIRTSILNITVASGDQRGTLRATLGIETCVNPGSMVPLLEGKMTACSGWANR